MRHLAPALAAAVLFVACASALPPPSRAVCYASADLQAQARVDAECRVGDAGVPLTECPAAEDILAELKREQELCL